MSFWYEISSQDEMHTNHIYLQAEKVDRKLNGTLHLQGLENEENIVKMENDKMLAELNE